MAKATEKDMEAALALCRLLEALDDGYLPDEMDGGSEIPIRYEPNLHASHVVEYLNRIQRTASVFRVCFGMTVVMDPANAILDQELSYLELHPRLRVCKEACEGIPDEALQSWLNPPEGQLGAPHGTWAAQLAAAGRRQVEMQKHINRLVSIAKTFRSHIGGATWTLVDDERELAKFIEEAIAEAEAA